MAVNDAPENAFKPVTLKYQNDGGVPVRGLKPGTKIELNEFVRSAHRLWQKRKHDRQRTGKDSV